MRKCKNKNFLFLYLTYKKFFGESEVSQKPVTRKTPVRNCCVFIYIYKEIDWKKQTGSGGADRKKINEYQV